MIGEMFNPAVKVSDTLVAVNDHEPTQQEKDILDGVDTIDDHTAVIISTSYGVGWCGQGTDARFDLGLVALIIKRDEVAADKPIANHDLVLEQIISYCYLKWGEECLGAINGLTIKWLPVGIKFKIEQYDGAEYIITENDLDLVA
jgi:hypothetical protein